MNTSGRPDHRELTQEEHATNAATWDHIHLVQTCLMRVIGELQQRALTHDQTKLRDPEVRSFTEVTHLLSGLTYGSPEYRANLRAIKPALRHHNAHNRHHPEHFADGVNGMTLVDLLELACDWKAASLRHDDGDLTESLRVNQERHGLSDQTVALLRNTFEFFGWLEPSPVPRPVSQRDETDPRTAVFNERRGE